MVTKYSKQHTICAKDGLEMWFSPNDEIRKCLIDMRLGSTKNAFETWITLNDVNGVSLFHLFYLITLMVYRRSQQTPNVQMKYFMWYWSIFTIFVLKRGCKREFLQMMIFLYVCSTCFIFELKTRFETWITGNDVHSVRLFLLSCTITLMAYLCTQWTQMSKRSILLLIVRS
jgi:hypothetical protein